MAEKIIKQLIDDTDGSEAHEIVEFTVRGVDYRIDLSDKNAAKFDAALKKWIDAAAIVGRKKRAPRSSSSRSREQLQAIRDWANQQGYAVSPRGRVAQSIIDDFEKAHQTVKE